MPNHEIGNLYRLGRRAALSGCVVGLLLGASKLVGGWYGHSVALVVDAIHSFGDALLSGVIWGALYWSQRPADREHPYGHTRAEAVAGSSVSLILVLSAFAAGWQSIQAFLAPQPEPPSGFTLAIIAVSFFVNESLYRYSRNVARKTKSLALHAASWDQRLDSLTALAIFVALALARIGPAWRDADHIAALGVAIVILVAGGSLFWHSVHELMDAQAEPELLQSVRAEALGVPGVRGVEKLLVRKTGLEYLVDIHVEVDPTATVTEGHAIGHAVKDQLMTRSEFIKDVLVHIEPATGGGAVTR
jgi:cation diffusion facilitator family transporter